MTGLFVASNPTALSAQFQLTRNMGALGDTLTRLSTGLRINSGKDDPAGLIASELLRAQITGTTQAITNTQRANGLIATADSSLGQIGNLLNDIKGLVVEAAQTGTMTAAQLEANQLQVDAALNSIDRIARTTNYGGKKLLDGSLDFRTAGRSAGVGNLQINSANFGTASAIGVNVNVTQAADYARLVSHGTGVGVDTTFDIIGNRGSATINVGAGTSNADIAAAINRSTDSTGVLAYVEGLAARGSITLSSAGANNDIVITALREGFDAGNYSFRITRGAENDARVVQESGPNQMGIIEISLVEAYEQRYNNFAGLFNITIDTTNRTDAAGANIADTAETSVTMTRGDANRVVYSDVDRAASTNVISGRSISAETTAGTPTSSLNGWTVVVNDAIADATANWRVDLDSKLVFVNSGSADTDVQDALASALASTNPGAGTAPVVDVTFNHDDATNPFQNGDRFTFAGGISAGEVHITYQEGARVNDILAMLNNAPNVSASLAHGVNGNSLIPMLPNGVTQMQTDHAGAGTTNSISRFTSGATAQDVIDLVNSKLGDKFKATALAGGASGGRVSFMDAAVDYGDVNLGNALRFTGMDNGPIIRMTTTGVNGMPIANQQLGINIILPSQADIEAGIHTPILEIRLATDQQGNSITSARQLVDFFNTLTPEQTMGVSVAQLFPPGVDPNGRIFGTGECGREVVLETCPTPIDGIVQPTGVPGLCGMQQGDLLLLGTNQRVVAANAVARIAGNNPMIPNDAVTNDDRAEHTGTTFLNFGPTSALNGMSFGFTRDETREGFDTNTGTLMIFMGPQFTDGTGTQGAALTTAVNDAVAANWEAIRVFTGATGDAARLDVALVTADVLTAVADAVLSDTPGAAWGAGLTGIRGSNVESDDTAGGVGTADPAMTITAKQAGTHMAGINIHFINDTESGLAEWDDPYTAAYAAGDALPEINVQFVTNQDGSRALIVTGNLGPDAASEVNAGLLARALNANATFSQHFTAAAMQTDSGAAAGAGEANSVLFTTDITKSAARTVGGYRIESAGTGATTSSGIGMTGQSDANERLIIESEELGSNAFLEVNVIRGFLNTVGGDGVASGYAHGRDMMATINGLRAVAQGNNLSINTADLALSMTVANGVGNHGFTITGGGALFQLGPDVVSQQQMRIGIGSMLTTNLGGSDGQLFLLRRGEVASIETGGDQGRKLADRIVNQAIQSVATTRGQLGAIQRGSLEPNILALQDSLTALTEANAMITNADFAVESSNLTRLQLLIQAGAQTLGIANQLPQYAAMLVR